MQINLKDTWDEKSDGLGLLLFKHFDEKLLPQGIEAKMKQAMERDVFQLESGKCRVFEADQQTVLIAGLGDVTEDLDLDDIREAVRQIMQMAKKEKIKHLTLAVQKSHIDSDYIYKTIIEMVHLQTYDFNHYKSDPKTHTFETIDLLRVSGHDGGQSAVLEGDLLGQAVNVARHLVNEPANKLYPQEMAERVQNLGEASGFDVEIIMGEQLEHLKMHAFLSVGQASVHTPRLIVMRYKGDASNEQVLGLVGKGLNYDSGGLSIKTATGMETMKTDMGGAAAVIGAMSAISKAQLKVNVTAVVAACENMIAGNSYKPGDILDTMAGKTIYIGNTDAEGRLTLVDAITYIIQKEKVAYVVDIATLTGAALMTLGEEAAVTLSNDDEFYKRLEKGALLSGEKIWRMPMFKAYEKQIKHHEADYTNMGGKPGSITAGMLLREFVEGKPWIHLDIAGVAHHTKAYGFLDKGATGYGVKSLYELAKSFQV